MYFHHNLLVFSNHILQTIRKFGINLGFISPNRLRVLTYHDIHQREEKTLIAQLKWLKNNWNIVSPSEFGEMIFGAKPIIGDNILITFDDGLISNRVVAEKILNPMDIQAIFFVISDFVDIQDSHASRRFINNYIAPKHKLSDIPEHWRNMQWKDLEALLKQGHTIGSHTKKHIRLSDCRSKSELEDEIILSADKIMKKLDINVEHFAYTFGDINSFSEEALGVAKQRFKYVFSGVRGDNANNVSPLAIRRDSTGHQFFGGLEYVLFNNKLLDAFLAGFGDFKYASDRKIIDQWCRNL